MCYKIIYSSLNLIGIREYYVFACSKSQAKQDFKNSFKDCQILNIDKVNQ